MSLSDPVVIVSALRTPMGGFGGCFTTVTATALGANTIKAVMAESDIGVDQIDEVIMGCVLPAGLKQAPARQAAIAAGLSFNTVCTTINKVCGSGMKAAMQAHDALVSGSINVAVAGGMESMSNVPYLLPKARTGLRMGHGQVIDHMMQDGLENAYDGISMGCFAQDTADKLVLVVKRWTNLPSVRLTELTKQLQRELSSVKLALLPSKIVAVKTMLIPTNSPKMRVLIKYPHCGEPSKKTVLLPPPIQVLFQTVLRHYS
jgi:hypothetical protein